MSNSSCSICVAKEALLKQNTLYVNEYDSILKFSHVQIKKRGAGLSNKESQKLLVFETIGEGLKFD